MPSLHHFSLPSIEGNTLHLADFKGKKLLLVNTASECGLTPQYEQLQEFHEQFQEKVSIIGFPSNDFGAQEPGTDAEIQTFCKVRFGVTFPLSTKITVKGPNAHPLYQWLTQQALNGKADAEMQWNFQKFLIDENGEWQAVFSPVTSVFDDEVLKAIGVSL